MRPMLSTIAAATTLAFTEEEYALNLNSLAINFTMGSDYTVTLPTIESLIAEHNGGSPFEIRGSLQGASTLRIQAGVDSDGVSDRICSEPHQFISGNYSCFILKVCGSKDWGFFECGNLDS